MTAGSAQDGTGDRRRDRDRCRIVACRDCCCGGAADPDVAHCDHIGRLRPLIEQGHAAVQMSGCLDNCERGSTIVVVPSRSGRAAGGRVTWLGEMHDDAAMTALADWASNGGPGHAAEPAALTDRLVRRSVRRAACND